MRIRTAELAEKEAELRLALDNMPGAVIFTDSLSLLVIGLGWALLLPALAECAQRWNGLETRPLSVEVQA